MGTSVFLEVLVAVPGACEFGAAVNYADGQVLTHGGIRLSIAIHRSTM